MRRTMIAHRSFWFAVGISATTSSISLLGGLGLQATQESLVRLVPLLASLPVLQAAADNYAATIAAHLSDPEIYPQRVRQLIRALAVSTPVTILAISAISMLVAWFEGKLPSIHQAEKYTIFYATLLAGVVFIIFVASYIANKALQKHRINSDDVLINATSSATSVLLLLGFAVAARFYF